jgi:hypothetical protein
VISGRRYVPPPRVGVVQRELDRFAGPRYLEIGVFTGVVFLNVRARHKVGVDPVGNIPWRRRVLHPRARLVEATSDEYFARLDPAARFDVVFVDGEHSYEQVLRDVENSLRHLSAEGAVLLHDANPPTEAAALPDLGAVVKRGEMLWCGDVWKAIVRLRALRDDLRVEVLDTDLGIGVVRRGSSATLPLDEAQVDALDYADLDANRAELLGLRPAA